MSRLPCRHRDSILGVKSWRSFDFAKAFQHCLGVVPTEVSILMFDEAMPARFFVFLGHVRFKLLRTISDCKR